MLGINVAYVVCQLRKIIYGSRGLDIWCIMGSNLIAIEKSLHGKFYTGNTYIILSVSFSKVRFSCNIGHILLICASEFTWFTMFQTVELKSGVRQHNVHYWVGEEAKEVCHCRIDLFIATLVLLGYTFCLWLCLSPALWPHRRIVWRPLTRLLSWM